MRSQRGNAIIVPRTILNANAIPLPIVFVTRILTGSQQNRIALTNYLQTDNAKRIGNLKAWLLILVGREWHVIEEVPVVD